jgi:hypothetical protein
VAFDNHPQPDLEPGFDAARGPCRFLVDKQRDVDRLYHRINNAGHPVGQEPHDAFWGERCRGGPNSDCGHDDRPSLSERDCWFGCYSSILIHPLSVMAAPMSLRKAVA